MSEPSPLKEEIKRSVVLEPIKILIGSLLTLVGTLILAAIPQVRVHIWPSIPKWLLLVLAVAFLLVTLALVPYAAYLRRRVHRAEAERDEFKAKPKYRYNFGLKWDEELNPRCPDCEAHLSAPRFVHQRSRPSLSFFACENCGRTSHITGEGGSGFLRFHEAKAKMVALTKADP
jgi:hypothetical protein